MKVAIITRSTLYRVPGGDTVQAMETADHLAAIGVTADVRLSNEVIDYDNYDLLHFFNIIRPADMLYHIKKAGKPYVVSTILVDYSEYDQQHRKGWGRVFTYCPPDAIEYLKTMARWLLGRDHLSSISYSWKGQRKSIMEVLNGSEALLPNSASEYKRLRQRYPCHTNYHVIPNGINTNRFTHDPEINKDDTLVLCVARIEGIKNQLNLIKALNDTRFKLLLIGNHSPSQQVYYNQCRNLAAHNIQFIEHLPQDELVAYYQQAKVHVLPSWFETTGLSSVEAAAMGCNIVITDKGDTREYFGDHAFYCIPGSPESILAAVERASNAETNDHLRQKIKSNYTWAKAAQQTHRVYQEVMAKSALKITIPYQATTLV